MSNNGYPSPVRRVLNKISQILVSGVESALVEIIVLCLVGFSAISAAILLRPIARRVGLVDSPGGRKLHDFPTPLVGGIFIYAGVAAGFVLSWPPSPLLVGCMVYGGLLLILGIVDDLVGVRPITRLLVEVMLSWLMIQNFPHLAIDSLSLFSFELALGVWSVPFTVLFVVALMNAFNLIDGIDGLAAVSFLLAFTVIGMVGTLHVESFSGLFVTTLVFSLCIFLSKNLSRRRRRKVLLGDSGCLMLGGLLSVLLLDLSSSLDGVDAIGGINLLIWSVSLPVFDMITVAIKRILSKRHPFEADRTHLHHLVVDGGVSPLRALLLLSLLMAMLMTLGLGFHQVSNTIGFGVFTIFLTLYIIYRDLAVQGFLRFRSSF